MAGSGVRTAPGAPGIAPFWTHSNKQGVGTAYSSDSRLWFTLWRGIVTETYYPTIDHPQLRDLQYLLLEEGSAFYEEKRNTESVIERLSDHALGYRVTNTEPGGRFVLEKTVIGDPHLPCLLMRTRLTQPKGAKPLQLFALAAPHLNLGGWGNHARVIDTVGRRVLIAEKDGFALALSPSLPFGRTSVGYVGASDGWTDLARHLAMTFDFDDAPDGNVALVGEIPYVPGEEFTLALAFGRSVAGAVSTLFQSLGTEFDRHLGRFLEQWERLRAHESPLRRVPPGADALYHVSHSVLAAHEDKVFPGSYIASLSIPWGASKGDENRGGYHLVWTRDMVNTATALLAVGERESPLRTLIYLATSQQADGGFPQNFWVDGTPYWRGVQLDEVAFPILLAWRLKDTGALQAFDPYPMVCAAARYLIERGPATEQERWEEVSGYSPSTLAVHIAALVCAAEFLRARGDRRTAAFLEEYADFLEAHIDRWTVTHHGTLVPGLPRHYVRILPVAVDDPSPSEDLDAAVVRLKNIPEGEPSEFPAREIVDGGFLELVRYGVRRPDDPVVVDSVKVLDRILKVDTPFGPAWHRYNHDGYGETPDGGPYAGAGVGRAWPLLTGERGHFELAAGRDPAPYLEAMRGFATRAGLLPEQVWDREDRPELHLEIGRPTESALPLAWSHAEYLKLARSASDGRVFDRIPIVAARYAHPRPRTVHVWKLNRQVREVPPGATLRVIASEAFTLHWSSDGWATIQDTSSTATGLHLEYADVAVAERGTGTLVFTLHWTAPDRWAGQDFTVRVGPSTAPF
ncbi:MAG: glycoside hydrolase family 15 protein [Thermoplasmata archaeon]